MAICTCPRAMSWDTQTLERQFLQENPISYRIHLPTPPPCVLFAPPQVPLHDPLSLWKVCRLQAHLPLTHIQRDCDDVQGHGGVCDAAEGRGLQRKQNMRCPPVPQ